MENVRIISYNFRKNTEMFHCACVPYTIGRDRQIQSKSSKDHIITLPMLISSSTSEGTQLSAHITRCLLVPDNAQTFILRRFSAGLSAPTQQHRTSHQHLVYAREWEGGQQLEQTAAAADSIHTTGKDPNLCNIVASSLTASGASCRRRNLLRMVPTRTLCTLHKYHSSPSSVLSSLIPRMIFRQHTYTHTCCNEQHLFIYSASTECVHRN
jgi:hypothetical protein